MNAESRPLQTALSAAGIPFVVREEEEERRALGREGWGGLEHDIRRISPSSDPPDAVSLLTYFRAKGLQWPVVFLTSCNEGTTPHRRSPVEDERRLFYVAMTRASSALHAYILDPEGGAHPPASRFLLESGLLRR